MAKIGIELNNYKAHGSFNLETGDYDLVVFNGDNRTGKSSIINGIIENISATNLSNEPLKRGTVEGEKSFIVQDKNGKETTVVHTFDKSNPKGTFYAIQDGKKISSVKKIRELMGEVNTYTVQDIFNMCKNTQGRRTFIKEVLMRCLSEEDRTMIDSINAKINSKDGTTYIKRRELNKELEVLKAANKLTEEEKVTLSKLEETKKSIENIKKRIDFGKDVLSKVDKILGRYNDIINDPLWEEFVTIDKLSFVEDPSKTILFEYFKNEMKFIQVIKDANFKEYRSKIVDKISQREKELSELEISKAKMDAIAYKEEGLKKSEENIKAKEKEIAEVNKLMLELSSKKDKILANSTLPKGLDIQGESDFTYNGFNFNESEISESEGWLLIAQLTIPIYDAKYYRMGNVNAFSKKAIQEICELANKTGKTVFLERVVDDIEDIYVETIINGIETETIKPIIEQKPKTVIENEYNKAVNKEEDLDDAEDFNDTLPTKTSMSINTSFEEKEEPKANITENDIQKLDLF